LRVPTDYASIQVAIDAAVSSVDEIEVAPGIYYEAINFNGKAIRLYSTDGPDVTTIDGAGGPTHVVQCVGGEGSNTVLDGFTITGGNAGRGGGMYNSSSSSTITNCTFKGNLANDGGGMYNYYSSPTISNCRFSDNSSGFIGSISLMAYEGEGGGGMYNYYSSPTITNCMFSGNIGENQGGGMLNYYSSNLTITNCTFIDNTASYGGGMMNWGSPTITNCILWGDSPEEVLGGSPAITYSNVQGSWLGEGNINLDPLFSDADGRLSADSPCIDTGDSVSVPADVTVDLDGNLRIQGAGVDMGAYEAPLAEPVQLVAIDIKPQGCPNPLNINGKGVLPVAILGTEDFDVFTIDPASIRLADIPAVRSSYEDVATPVPNDADICECTTAGPDGYLDLTLKFDVQEIVAALGEVNDGDEFELMLTGVLDEALGGTPIEGKDCIVIISKGKPE